MGLRGRARIDIVDCIEMHYERNVAVNLEHATVASFLGSQSDKPSTNQVSKFIISEHA
jgi:hypothetical protein